VGRGTLPRTGASEQRQGLQTAPKRLAIVPRVFGLSLPRVQIDERSLPAAPTLNESPAPPEALHIVALASKPTPREHPTVAPSFPDEFHALSQPPTPVRGFDVAVFETWAPWLRVMSLLKSGHGAYGLSGPRGIGKTWLMRRAVEYARDEGGIGLWYPSPSEYDSSAFLAALTETFAGEVEERRRRQSGLRYAELGYGGLTRFRLLVMNPRFPFAAAGVVAAYVWFGLVLFGVGFGVSLAIVASVALILIPLVEWLRRLRLAGTREGRLSLYAKQLKEAVRFALTKREALDLGAQGGKGVVGRFGLSRGRELVERPVTLSSLIHDFRELTRLAGEAADPAPVIIAVDELDKLTDHDKVRQLLRDIKGIFGVQNVHFLVSVSHEAARALNLNGLEERNEFNSSFDVVVELEPVGVAALEAMLVERRGWLGEPTSARALAVLSAGIPREAIRLGELVLAASPELVRAGARDAVPAAMRAEALEHRRDVVTAPSDGSLAVSEASRVGVFEALPETLFLPDRFPKETRKLLSKYIEPPWNSDKAWEQRFGEEWRRLIVRLGVAGLLVDEEQRPSDDDLQRIISISTQSAAVATLMLDEMRSSNVNGTSSTGKRALLRRALKGLGL
jgi:hypothetical protein